MSLKLFIALLSKRNLKGASGEITQEMVKVALRYDIVLEPVVAQRPEILHSVIQRRTGGEEGQRLKQGRRLLEFAILEVCPGGRIFCINVIALQHRIILGLAGKYCRTKEQDRNYYTRTFHLSRKFLTSKAARHPDAAAVIA